MFRIITINLNGIRSAAKKGFFDWLTVQKADVVCVQEIKAHAHQIDEALFRPHGYQAYFHFAEKKGYSGVGVFSKHPVKKVIKGLGFETADREGRYLALDLGKVVVASLYMPSGTSGEERQRVKFEFLDHFKLHLASLKQSKKDYIICGDFNIAHKQIDLKNWRSNQKHSGFLPEERRWMDHIIGKMGYVDAFRVINQSPDYYTWWSNRGRAWEKNVGWRLDYQVITNRLKPFIRAVEIYKNQRFSDHAPLTIDYNLTLY